MERCRRQFNVLSSTTMKITAICFLCFFQLLVPFRGRGSTDLCHKWAGKVDPSVGDNDEPHALPAGEVETIEAIACLLRLEGNLEPARFSGVTHMDESQTLPRATVEVGALYYASYVFLRHWDHASGIAIVDQKGRFNQPSSVHRAYRYYRRWLSELQRIGVSEARKQHLDPVQGSGLRWYGN